MKTVQVKNEMLVPEQMLEQIADMAAEIVLKKIEARLCIWEKFIDLPPTPNKSQIMKTLGIGNDTLNFLIQNGATPMVWGENTVRIERADLRKAFDNTKIKV